MTLLAALERVIEYRALIGTPDANKYEYASAVEKLATHAPELLAALKANDKLQSFAAEILGYLPEGAPDGMELGEIAVKHGLTEEVEVATRCGEKCQCAEYIAEPDDWPVLCYRWTTVMAVIAEAPASRGGEVGP